MEVLQLSVGFFFGSISRRAAGAAIAVRSSGGCRPTAL
jgi:hypothetical protein